MRQFKWIAPWCVLCVWVFMLVVPQGEWLILDIDSAQYEEVADEMALGRFFELSPQHRPSLGAAIRAPLYPAALVVAKAISPRDLKSGLVVVHAVAAAVCIALSMIMLRRFLPMSAVALFAGVALFSIKQVFWAHMSEWLTAIFALLVWVAVVRWSYERVPRNVFAVVTFLTFLLFTRFSFLPWLILLPAIVVLSPRATRLGHLIVSSLIVVPLVAWGWFNMQRLGAFSLSHHGAYALVATARSLGEIPEKNSDSPAIRSVINGMNVGGVSISDQGMEPERVHSWDGEFYLAYHKNFNLSCELLYSGDLPQPQVVAVAGDLLWRSIRAHFGRYRMFLAGGMSTFMGQYALPLLALLILQMVLLVRRGRDAPLAVAGLLLAGVVAVYMGSIFTALLWVHRYFSPIQPVVLVSIFLALFGVLRGVWAKRVYRVC